MSKFYDMYYRGSRGSRPPRHRTFDDWFDSTPDDAYLGTSLGTTTIRVTDSQIEIAGDWIDLKVLAAIKTIEAGSGQRALWTGDHYTFPVAALPVVEDAFRDQIGQVNWVHDGVTRDTTSTIKVFLKYCGQCRSRQSKQPQRMKCKDCNGTGIARGQMFNYVGPQCRTCQGNGAIAAYPDVEPYAYGWWNGGWNIRFPEKVLRAYFGEPEVKFNGNFYEALLSSTNISKKYKQLARQYHPDVYNKGSHMFLKLREAYDVLRDPVRRKRYQAGLKFQQLTAQVQNDVVFEVPRNCGDLVVKGQYDESGYDDATAFWMKEEYTSPQPVKRLLVVSEIINWNDRIDPRGRIMTSTWNPAVRNNRGWQANQNAGMEPFTITWELPPVEFIVNI